MNRNVIIIAAVAACAATAPLHAQDNAIGSWVGQVNRQIDRGLAAQQPEVTGTTTISFRRGADGRATDISSAGRGTLAQVALRTVKRLHDLPPLPAGFSPAQLVTMNVLVGDPADVKAYDAKRRVMLAQAGKSNEQLAMRSTGTQVAMVSIP